MIDKSSKPPASMTITSPGCATSAACATYRVSPGRVTTASELVDYRCSEARIDLARGSCLVVHAGRVQRGLHIAASRDHVDEDLSKAGDNAGATGSADREPEPPVGAGHYERASVVH